MQAAIALLKSSSCRLVGAVSASTAGQMSLETLMFVPPSILNTGVLPVLTAWAASR